MKTLILSLAFLSVFAFPTLSYAGYHWHYSYHWHTSHHHSYHWHHG